LSFTSTDGEIKNRELYRNVIHERLELLYKKSIQMNVQDARDYHVLTRLLVDFKPQVIIHLAAVAHANKSNKDPYSTFGHSLRTLENALDIARAKDLNVQHFIFFSSSMVYGHFKSGIVSEETICEPLGIYGALKFSGEKLVIAYNQVFDLPYTIIRPSALYGERCVSRRVGQIFIENAINGLEVSIAGDGSDRLDFTYIDDLVQGIIKVLENENSKNQIFNLTYGQSSSLADMADILKKHFPDVKINYLPKDKLVPDRGTLSVEKAKELIGYAPQYPLEKGFVKYIEWYKELFK
jgi:nucleoside-diphosphate-sugar epimerase